MTNQDFQGVVAHGFSTLARNGAVLDAWYPLIDMGVEVTISGTDHLSPGEATYRLGPRAAGLVRRDERRDVEVVCVSTRIADLCAPALDCNDYFLRLHLLSNRYVRPGEVNLDGLLDQLGIVAWTSLGPCLPERVEEARWMARAQGAGLTVNSIWWVPRMTDYVTPPGIKIINAASVSLGAYLAAGTMVTAAGFCNFDSGTLGPTVVEGTISLGVTVGEGCHIGDGATLMGTTSGGGSEKVSIGRNCLLGAKSGVGVSLGNDCIVEAGCFVTAGARVMLPDGRVVKSVELSGQPSILFRRHSQTGRLEAVPAPGWPGLNPVLHRLK